MKRIFFITLLLTVGCRVGSVLDEHIEHNATEIYDLQKKQLSELAPAYDAERLSALKDLTKDKPFTADMLATSKATADRTAAGVAYRKQEAAVEAAEFRLADASQRLGPPYGKTAKEMELARQTDEDERLISALKNSVDNP